MIRFLMRQAVAIIGGALLVACTRMPVGDVTLECPELPATFHQEDLVGTWAASYSLNDSDVLIIRSDGTY